MSIDSKVRKPSQLSLDFMKRERTSPSQEPSSFGRNLAVGLTGLSLLAAASVAYSRIPEQPPIVTKFANAVTSEPATYSGGPYIGRLNSGKTEVYWVNGLFSDSIFYTDLNGDKIVDDIVVGGKTYNREKDFAKNSQVFLKADRKFQEVLRKNEQHLQKPTQMALFLKYYF